MICEILSFSELTQLARSDELSWQIVDYEVKRRFIRVLCRFMTLQQTGRFLRTLNRCEGAVGGLAALETILFVETRHCPIDYDCLEILLPSNPISMDVMVAFFRKVGYTGLEIQLAGHEGEGGQSSHRAAGALGRAPASNVSTIRTTLCLHTQLTEFYRLSPLVGFTCFPAPAAPSLPS
jgi:hypothetical protein